MIDFHVHVGQGAHKTLSPDDLLREMDRHGITRALLCPVDECLAVRNAEGNDFVLQAVRAHPDRFSGMAVASPWCGADAVEELCRALDEGLVGLKVNSVVQGFMLCDPIIYPLLDVVAESGSPVYAHTGSMNNALPLQLLDLAEQYPELPFVMGHVAFSDFWYDVVPALRRAANMYVETSHTVPDYLIGVISELGTDRVLFGSDLPASILELELAKVAMLELPADQTQAILHDNAAGLLEACHAD